MSGVDGMASLAPRREDRALAETSPREPAGNAVTATAKVCGKLRMAQGSIPCSVLRAGTETPHHQSKRRNRV